MLEGRLPTRRTTTAKARRVRNATATMTAWRLVCVLLAEVDSEFVAASGNSRVWPNPHADGGQADESEFGRCSDPNKFLIVAIRAQAWAAVLLERGWATVTSDVDWAFRPIECGGADLVLAPQADGAVPLVLTTHQPSTIEHPVNISIAAGDPAVSLASIPDLRMRRMRQRIRSVDRANRHVDTLCCRRITLCGCLVRALFVPHIVPQAERSRSETRPVHDIHCCTMAAELECAIAGVRAA